MQQDYEISGMAQSITTALSFAIRMSRSGKRRSPEDLFNYASQFDKVRHEESVVRFAIV